MIKIQKKRKNLLVQARVNLKKHAGNRKGLNKGKRIKNIKRIAYSKSPFGRKGYRGRRDKNKIQFFNKFGKQVRPILTYLDIRWMTLPRKTRKAILRRNPDAGYSRKRLSQIRMVLWTILKKKKKLLWINVHGFWYCISGISKMIFNNRRIPFRGRGARRYKKILGLPQTKLNIQSYLIGVRKREINRCRIAVRLRLYQRFYGRRFRRRGRLLFKWRWRGGRRVRRRIVLVRPRGFRKRSFMRRRKNLTLAKLRRVVALDDLRQYKKKLIILNRNFRNSFGQIFSFPEYNKLLKRTYFSPARKAGRLEYFLSQMDRKLVFVLARIAQYAPRNKTVALLCHIVGRGLIIVNGQTVTDLQYIVELLDILEYNYTYYFVEYQYHRALVQKKLPFFFFRRKRVLRLWRFGGLANKIIDRFVSYIIGVKTKRKRDDYFILRKHSQRKLSWLRHKRSRKKGFPESQHKVDLKIKMRNIRNLLQTNKRRRRLYRYYPKIPKRLRKRRVKGSMGAFSHILPRYSLPFQKFQGRRKIKISWYEFSAKCISVVLFHMLPIRMLPFRRFTRKNITALMLFGKTL